MQHWISVFKPALDLVEPGGRSWREVDVKPRMPDQSVLDPLGLVCAVVVHDQMLFEHRRRVGIDRASNCRNSLLQ